jgi:hypothetical protein
LFDDTKLTDAAPTRPPRTSIAHHGAPDRVEPSRRPHVVVQSARRSKWPASLARRRIRSTAAFSGTRQATSPVALPRLARGVFSRAGQRERFTPEQQRDRSRQGMRHISGTADSHGPDDGTRRRSQWGPDPRLRGRSRQRRIEAPLPT